MPRTPKADPEMVARIREARAAEDAALAGVAAAQTAVDAATEKRADALAALDVTVSEAENELAQARADVVYAAGLDRAALALGMSRTGLRKSLPPKGRASGTTRKRTVPVADGQPASHIGGEL